MNAIHALRIRRSNQQTARLRILTRELAEVQTRIAGRLGEYEQECAEAVGLVFRASALTDRLKTVRQKLQLAFAVRRRMTDIEGAMRQRPPPASWQASQPVIDSSDTESMEDALPGLGIDDDFCPRGASDKLPQFSDDLDDYVEQCPPEFVCPITCAVMRFPAQTCDGHRYEKVAIEEWFRSFEEAGNPPTSPLTNLFLDNTHLTPDYTLRSKIQEWAATARMAKKAADGGSRDPSRPCTPAPAPKKSPARAPAHPLARSLVFHGAVSSPSHSVSPAAPSERSARAAATEPEALVDTVSRERRRTHWSSSHVPDDESDAHTLNAIRDLASFEPPMQGTRAVARRRSVPATGASSSSSLAQGAPRPAVLLSVNRARRGVSLNARTLQPRLRSRR